MKKWEELTKEERKKLIKFADSIFIPPNLVPEMYERGELTLNNELIKYY